ncbi:6-phosphofructokinase, alpha subunit [Ascosphaera pollenicola]|nr:6-phosphofructokinase, alpha subunit [Ascosphaera pollenicola]
MEKFGSIASPANAAHNLNKLTVERKRRIAVVTSGGDAPGMNGFVRAVVRTSLFNGCDAYAVHEGYEGLVAGGEYIRKMEWRDVRGWLSRGGTLIGSARSKNFRTRDGRLKAVLNLVTIGIDALVVCGGDGSLTGADVFRGEWPGLLEELETQGRLTKAEVERHRHLNIVGAVGSIDNDLSGTDATIGCFSALHRIIESVDDVFDTASSHQRGFIIEVMGRHCGWLALMSAISSGADWLFIPECPPADGWEDTMCDIISNNRRRGKRRTIVIVAEGAQNRKLEKISSDFIQDILANRLKLDTRVTVLGHIQRGGLPCVFDRCLATMQGVRAVDTILKSTPEQPSYIITLNRNRINRTPLMEAVKLTHSIADAIQNQDFEKAMSLRDPDFKAFYRAYINTTTPHHEKLLLDIGKRMRVAVIHIGAPAGGYNPATRGAMSYCIARGHTPVAILNGFPGLIRHHASTPSSVREVNWLESDSWVNFGGSELGTNRTLPSTDMKTVAYCFEKYKFDALFIIGGFEAFAALSELRKARDQYAALRIPMMLLPATLSNNVPGTEYTLGSDTCLNALMKFCDVIRVSASSSRHRVFIVETQGGRSGYVATVGGLCVGAYAVYVPEEGICLDDIKRDVRFLRESFELDNGIADNGKLVLRNERASKTYTTQVLADIYGDEGKTFETRVAVPGHFQQGGKPSPMDRLRGFSLAIKCMEHIESFIGKHGDAILNDDLSSAVIGVKGSEVVISPMGGVDGLEDNETDWPDRRPKYEYWRSLEQMINMLGGRPVTAVE